METKVLIKGVFKQRERVKESLKTSSKDQLRLSFGEQMKKSRGGALIGAYAGSRPAAYLYRPAALSRPTTLRLTFIGRRLLDGFAPAYVPSTSFSYFISYFRVLVSLGRFFS